MRTANVVAVKIGGEQRDVIEVLVGQVDAEDVACLRLDDLPGGHAADRGGVASAGVAVGGQSAVLDQLAGGVHLAVCGGDRVRAQEPLVRRMRGVGLVLIDVRCGGVQVLVDVVGGTQYAVGPRQHGGPRLDHEVGRAAGNEQRVIRLQRHEDGAVAALGDE